MYWGIASTCCPSVPSCYQFYMDKTVYEANLADLKVQEMHKCLQ